MFVVEFENVLQLQNQGMPQTTEGATSNGRAQPRRVEGLTNPTNGTRRNGSNIGTLLGRLASRENPRQGNKEYKNRAAKVQSRADLIKIVFGKAGWREDHDSLASLAAEIEAYWIQYKDKRARELKRMESVKAKCIMKSWLRLDKSFTKD